MSRVITREQIEFFENMFSAYADTDLDVRDDYSGRGMMGDQCFGIVIDSQKWFPLAQFVLSLALEHDPDRGGEGKYTAEDAIELMTSGPGYKTDNMGYDTIVYWPSVTVEDEGEDDEE